jgi:hypothetical protein
MEINERQNFERTYSIHKRGRRVLLGAAFDKSEGNSGICDEQIGEGVRVDWSKAILP